MIPILLLLAVGGLMQAARSFTDYPRTSGTELAFGFLLTPAALALLLFLAFLTLLAHGHRLLLLSLRDLLLLLALLLLRALDLLRTLIRRHVPQVLIELRHLSLVRRLARVRFRLHALPVLLHLTLRRARSCRGE